mgnify:CR=1 FL=1
MTWTTTDIEQARNRDLAPILAHAGYKLHQLPNGLVLVRNFHGLLIRGNRWTWKAENLARNTIDFFMTIEAITFNQTMELLCASEDNLSDEPPSARRPSPHDDDGHEPL